MLYNYYGDNMTENNVIVSIYNKDDINKITDDTRYINICIDSVSDDVIHYFILNGRNYLYTDSIDFRNGFIYASYDIFNYAETIIDNIICNMPNELDILEKIRYVYIYLGKVIGSDINTLDSSNEFISYSNVSVNNNIWSALSSGMIGNVSVCKLFLYVCHRLGIKCELINSNIKGTLANKVYMDNDFIIVDLFNDLYNIHGGFSTIYFDKYNDDKDMDKKINYIKDEYMNYYIDSVLKDFTYDEDNVLDSILSLTSSVINIASIGTLELSKIYKYLFEKYISSYVIKINNFFVKDNLGVKKHFVVFGYNDSYYSFNYSKGCFVRLNKDIIGCNIDSNRIGIYDYEEFELNEKSVVL